MKKPDKSNHLKLIIVNRTNLETLEELVESYYYKDEIERCEIKGNH